MGLTRSIRLTAVPQYAVLYEALRLLDSISEVFLQPAPNGGSTLDEILRCISGNAALSSINNAALSSVELIEPLQKLANAAAWGHVVRVEHSDKSLPGKNALSRAKYSLSAEGQEWLDANIGSVSGYVRPKKPATAASYPGQS